MTHATFFGELQELLAAPSPAKEFVLDLIRWLDRHEAPEETSLNTQTLIRAFVACGSSLEHLPTVACTLRAAREFIAEPTEAQWDALLRAATDSYPFGPGDGCFAIAEIGYTRCEPGSGCRSGAGTLACIAHEVGYDAVADAVRVELGKWLREQVTTRL